MSAHRIYCYSPQRDAAVSVMEDIGFRITRDCPCPVSDEHQLRSLDHITFITIDTHPQPIPQRMWEVIMQQGALVIHVDDQYERGREAARRVPVTHYPGAAENGEKL